MTKRTRRAEKPNPRADRNERGYSNQKPHLALLDSNSVEPIKSSSRRKRVDLIPRNITQERYIKALENEQQHIVFAMGPAGTGKTMLATQYAIKAYQEGIFDKIVITRPAVSVDEQHGFLPGTLFQKMEPWILPILDVFKEHYSPQQVTKLIEDEIIEISPLAYMRGRTFKNSIILFDESQNSTVSQMMMVLSRIGDNAKMIVTGDINQHDRGFEKNGLKDFVERFSKTKSEHITMVQFESKDIERHPIIEEILDLYKDIQQK